MRMERALRRKRVVSSFEQLTEGVKESEEVKEIRSQMFRYLMELFGTWQEPGDCLPEVVMIGSQVFTMNREVIGKALKGGKISDEGVA